MRAAVLTPPQPAILLLCLTLPSTALWGCRDDAEPAQESAYPAQRSVAAPEVSWLADGRPPIESPVLTCPAGWRATTSAHDAPVCDPWPESGRTTCDADAIHVPGTSACSPLGPTCPQDGWADDLPQAGVLYVSQSAAADGDGSQDAPFATIAQAAAAASPGDTIALGLGTWDEAVMLPADVSMRGACVSGSIITRSTCADEDLDAAVNVAPGVATIQDLTIADAECGGLQLDGGAVTVHDVAILGVRRSGLWVRGGVVTAHDVLVQGTRARESDGRAGNGVDVRDEGSLSLERAALLDNYSYGAWLWSAGGTSTLTDVVISGTQAQFDGDAMTSLQTSNDHTLAATRLVLEDAYGGILVTGAQATFEDVVIRQQSSEPKSGNYGRCVESFDGADVAMQRVWASGCSNVGALTSSAGLSITDAVFEDLDLGPGAAEGAMFVVVDGELTLERVVSTDPEGEQVVALDGSQATVRHAQLSGTAFPGSGCGLYADISQISLDHVEVLDTATCAVFSSATANVIGADVRIAGSGTLNAPGLDIMGRATFDRLLMEERHGAGAWVYLSGDLTLRDSILRQIMPDQSGDFGEGMWVGDGGEVTLERLQISDVSLFGILVDGADSVATLTDVSIADLTGDGDDVGGDGLHIRDGAQVSGEGLQIYRARQAGVHVSTGAEAVLSQVWIAETLPQLCAESTCTDTTAAVGVHASEATVTLSDFGLVDNGTAGVSALDGTINLSDGGIAGHPTALVGTTITADDSVSIVDNDVKSDTAEPLPLASP